MEFLKFTILNEKADQQIGIEEQTILINRNHIVSIKPINILVSEGEVIKGYWIRNSNGKKYKATNVPMEIANEFGALNNNLPFDDEIETSTLNQ